MEVAPREADGPPLVDAVGVAQVERHVAVALFTQVLPPAGLDGVHLTEAPETRDGVEVIAFGCEVGRGELAGGGGEDGRRRIGIDGVGACEERGRESAHGHRLGVGERERSLLGAERPAEGFSSITGILECTGFTYAFAFVVIMTR